jgi:hypothetical protein
MRPDMNKVITETARHGGYDNLKGRHKDKFKMDELPITAPMSKNNFGFHKKTKEFSDKTGPLKRFIRSRVGKPWNAVYSEICENIKPTSTVQRHILEHVKWIVETNTFIEDGKIYTKSSNGQIFAIGNDYWREFYVHPNTGILCVTDTRSKKWVRKEPEWRKVISGELQLHRIDGIWYEVWLKEYNVTERRVPIKSDYRIGLMRTVYEGGFGLKDMAYDMAVMSNIQNLLEKYGKRGVFCYKKVQLSKKGLRKYELRNAA